MTERFQVIKNQHGAYEFSNPNPEVSLTTIYLTAENNPQTTAREVLTETTEANFQLELSHIDYRPYFIVENNEETYLIGTRNIEVAGMNNFRDMGGYQGEHGKHVKWGVLYRSDQIYNATAAGLEFLKGLGIHTIIDYRSIDEIEKYPNPEMENEVTTYNLDPSAHTAELSAQFQSSKEEEDQNLIASIIEQKNRGALVNRYDIVMEQYNSFVTKDKSKKAFGKMLQVLADEKAIAIDQHCRGGKDRTGFGGLLVLGILGVSKEDIVADYMLTYENRLERNQVKMANYKKITQDQDVLNYLYSLIETRPEFIEASYDKIIQDYGSIENYAIDQLGFTSIDIEKMKVLYLE